jgi:hypothetical protein
MYTIFRRFADGLYILMMSDSPGGLQRLLHMLCVVCCDVRRSIIVLKNIYYYSYSLIYDGENVCLTKQTDTQQHLM